MGSKAHVTGGVSWLMTRGVVVYGTFLLLVVSGWFLGCTPPEKEPPKKVPGPTTLRPDKDYNHEQMTESKMCKVEIEFPDKAADAPLNEVFDMIVRVKKADGGSGKFDLEINQEYLGVKSPAMLAVMPAHGHGMDVLPKKVRIDDSTFRLTGMLLHMPGWWLISLTINEGCGEGKVEFNTYLEPPKVDLSKLATGTKVEFTPVEFAQILRLSPLGEVPKSPTNKYADNADAAHLGQYLFFDTNLSKPKDGGPGISCATCHDPQKGWADELVLSKGTAVLGRHSPSLWNVAYNRWYFWDGRADSLWSQAIKPMEDGNEMNGDRVSILLYFQKNTALKQAYNAIFSDKLPEIKDLPVDGAKPVPCPSTIEGDDEQMKEAGCGKYSAYHVAWETISKADQTKINRFFSNIGKAIAAFERKIVSKDSAFDEFVSGIRDNKPDKLNALKESAQRGLKLFIAENSCVTCHNGPNFTNNEFHNLGLLDSDRPKDAKLPDLGRAEGLRKLLSDTFSALGEFSDDKDKDAAHNAKLKFLGLGNDHAVSQFKTPTLRDIASSKPYMHDGRFKDLEAVVAFYSHFGIDPKDEGKCKFENQSAPLAALPRETALKLQLTALPEGCPLPKPSTNREEFLRLLLLSKDEQADVVNFLKSLSGKKLPDNLLVQPNSPMRK